MKILLFSNAFVSNNEYPNIEFIKSYDQASDETAYVYFKELFRYAADDKFIFTLYPDMFSLSDGNRNFNILQSEGNDIRIVQNMEEALLNAKRKRRNTVIFPAFGYQNLTAAAAATIMKAMMDGITNFRILNDLKSEKALLEGLLEQDNTIEGVLLTTETANLFGKNRLMELAAKCNVYFSSTNIDNNSVSENLDALIHNIYMKNQRQNLHASIRDFENKTIDAVISEVFELQDGEWKNYGLIPSSKYRIREKYLRYELT